MVIITVITAFVCDDLTVIMTVIYWLVILSVREWCNNGMRASEHLRRITGLLQHDFLCLSVLLHVSVRVPTYRSVLTGPSTYMLHTPCPFRDQLVQSCPCASHISTKLKHTQYLTFTYIGSTPSPTRYMAIQR